MMEPRQLLGSLQLSSCSSSSLGLNARNSRKRRRRNNCRDSGRPSKWALDSRSFNATRTSYSESYSSSYNCSYTSYNSSNHSTQTSSRPKLAQLFPFSCSSYSILSHSSILTSGKQNKREPVCSPPMLPQTGTETETETQTQTQTQTQTPEPTSTSSNLEHLPMQGLNQWEARQTCYRYPSLTPHGYGRQLSLWLCCLMLMVWVSSFHCMLGLRATLASEQQSGGSHVIHVKVGGLFEESDHEQANMFIRTIKMINERRDETIRQLLNIPTGGGHEQQQQQHHLQPNRHRLRQVSPSEQEQEQEQPRGQEGYLEGANYQVSSGNFSELTTTKEARPAKRYDGSLLQSANEPSTLRQEQQHPPTAEAAGSPIRAAGPPLAGQVPGWTPSSPVIGAAGHRSGSTRISRNSKPAVVVKLEPVIEFLGDRQSSFEADCKVCQLIESGARALVGPTDGASIQHVQSICDNLEIPYFELRPFIGSIPTPAAAAAAAAAALASPLPALAAAGQPHPPAPSAGTSNQQQQQSGRLTSPSESRLQSERRFTTNLIVNGSVNSLPSSWPGGQTDGASAASAAAEAETFFGLPRVVDSSSVVQSIQQQLTAGGVGGPNRLEDLTLNLYPPAHLLTSAYIDLIYAWNWTSFAIVYEEGSSMIKLQDLFRESSGTWTSKWRIKLFQFNSPLVNYAEAHKLPSSSPIIRENSLKTGSKRVSDLDGYYNDTSAAAAAGGAAVAAAPSTVPHSNSDSKHGSSLPDAGGRAQASSHHRDSDQETGQPAAGSSRRKRKTNSTFRDLFWRIRDSGEQNILLDVRTEHLFEALKQAQQVGCMTEHYSYLITSLDLHTIDLEDFKYSRTRMTAFSILQVARSPKDGDNNEGSGGGGAMSPPLSASASSSSASTSSSSSQHDQSSEQSNGPLFDEKYLEKLGLHVITNSYSYSDYSESSKRAGKTHHSGARWPADARQQQGSFTDPQAGGSYKDWARREQLLSSPASMGLLPSIDRDNEYKLFEFFIDQQERNLSHVRLSTASAILHDSLILYMLGLNELDPSAGNFVGPIQQAIACSLGSQPWLHGSSMVNYMRQISFTGLTGPISFDQRGLRANFKLNMMGMAPDIGLVKVGEWHSNGGLDGNSWPGPTSTLNGSSSSSSGGSNLIDNDYALLNPLRKSQFTDSSSNHHHHRQQQQQQQQASNARTYDEQRQSYEEQSLTYELELKRYKKLMEDGNKVTVPYTKALNRQGSLMVNGIIYERLYRDQEDQVDILIVTTKLSQPYFMLKETPNKLTGNDQYEGFAVDLIHELSKLVNFKYRWREVADKKYGSKELLANGTVQWNGMIGELLRGQADLAIVDLTITAQREEAVDFTLPFMNTGISILFKKPTTKVTTLFSFLSPFSSDVWAYVLAAYCGISAILFLVGHLSPYEWSDPHPCRHSAVNVSNGYSNNNGDDDDDDNYGTPTTTTTTKLLTNQFSLLNSFWFTIGSLMQQGSDLTPRSMSTRTIAGIWYFFTLIMISSYTANLAAFLTVEKVVYPIENVRDLSNQQEIKYGCVESGSTCTFFQDSQIDTYRHINEQMRKFRTYVRSNDDGQKRVEEGKFAFFMESASIEYIVERNCNLTQIGGLLDSKGYGLATSKKSRLKRPYRTLLSEGILHLQETGMLHMLKNRWWKERRGGGTCTDDGKGGGVTELSLANVGGVFVVLLGGLGISFLVAIAEFMWRSRRSGSTRDRMCEEMMSDLKFALACKRSMKPVARRANNSATSTSSNRQPQQQQQLLPPDKRSDSGSRGRRRRQQFGVAGAGSGPNDNDEFQWHQQLAHYDPSMSQFDRAAVAVAQHAELSSWRMADASSRHQQQRQQSADSASQAAEESYAKKAAAGKPCDPILLHAMLTMLMQQQQTHQPGGELMISNDAVEQALAAVEQQQQQQQHQRQRQQIQQQQQQQQQQHNYNHQEKKYRHPLRQLASAAAAATSTDDLDPGDNYHHLGQLKGFARRRQVRPPLFVPHSFDTTLSARLGQEAYDSRMEDGQQQQPVVNAGWLDSSVQTHRSEIEAAAAAAAADKRRSLLFAQKTIDTLADESGFLGQ